MVPPLLLVALLWAMLIGDILPADVCRSTRCSATRRSSLVASPATATSRSPSSPSRRWSCPPGCGVSAGSRRPPDTYGIAGSVWRSSIWIFLVAIVADGYPSFGSDVGGVLALVPAGAVVVLMLSGRRVNVAKLAIIASASVLVLAVFAGIDLTRPPQDRTHLGRLVASTAGNDGGGLGTVLDRKISANVHVLSSSVFIWIIPSALLFLAFLTWRRRGFIRNLMEFVPGIRACLWGSIIVAVLGFALNDSGMAIPAMMFPVLLPYLMHLLVQPDSGPDAQAPRWLEGWLARLERDDATAVREADVWEGGKPSDDRKPVSDVLAVERQSARHGSPARAHRAPRRNEVAGRGRPRRRSLVLRLDRRPGNLLGTLVLPGELPRRRRARRRRACWWASRRSPPTRSSSSSTGPLITTRGDAGATTVVLVAVLGFCLLGLLDDLAATGSERGFTGHLRALAQGRLTTGGLKLRRRWTAGTRWSRVAARRRPRRAAGGRAASSRSPPTPGNLFDRAPGRTIKVGAARHARGAAVRLRRPTALQLTGVAIVLGAALGAAAVRPPRAADARRRRLQRDRRHRRPRGRADLRLPIRIVVLIGLVALNMASERVSFSGSSTRSAPPPFPRPPGRAAAAPTSTHAGCMALKCIASGSDPSMMAGRGSDGLP